MKQEKSKFVAVLSSIFAPIAGSCGGACGVACFAGGCCGGTALFGLIGISGSTMMAFEKLTPLFLAVTIVSLSYGFYNAYKPKKVVCCDTPTGDAGSACCVPEQRTSFFQSKTFLWITAVFCVIMWSYPYLSATSNSSPGNILDDRSSYNGNAAFRDSTSSISPADRNAASKAEPCCPSDNSCATECGE